MKIAICEDNQTEADWLRKVIEEWAAGSLYDMQVLWYSETKQFFWH